MYVISMSWFSNVVTNPNKMLDDLSGLDKGPVMVKVHAMGTSYLSVFIWNKIKTSHIGLMSHNPGTWT